MTDYTQTVQTLINSITSFLFEFDFEAIIKEMELREVPKEELDKLGEEEIRNKFHSGIFKIKLANGAITDFNSIAKYCAENDIKEPLICINPNVKYVQWVIEKNFITQQIKKHIKNQLKNNSELNLTEIQKALVVEDVKNKRTEGFINELPVKTSNLISEEKFLVQVSCSPESAIKIINEAVEELKKERKKYIASKFKRDCKYRIFYCIFVLLLVLFWSLNKQSHTLPIWLSYAIGLILFLTPLVVMRFINLSIFDSLFYKQKAEKKYEKEFNNIVE